MTKTLTQLIDDHAEFKHRMTTPNTTTYTLGTTGTVVFHYWDGSGANNTPLAEDDIPLAEKVIALIQRHNHSDNLKWADVYIDARKPATAMSDPGWLEWLVQLRYHSGGGMTIGVIQRRVGADVECHS